MAHRFLVLIALGKKLITANSTKVRSYFASSSIVCNELLY